MVKRYKIRITPKAQLDLQNIIQYLRKEQSDTVADNVKDGILKAIDKLETFPEVHKKFEELCTEQVVFRRMLQWKYKIVFTIDKDELVVLVVKIYHGRQSQEDIIEELTP